MLTIVSLPAVAAIIANTGDISQNNLFFKKKHSLSFFRFFQARRLERPSRQRHPCPHQQDAVNAMVHGCQQVPGIVNKTKTSKFIDANREYSKPFIYLFQTCDISLR